MAKGGKRAGRSRSTHSKRKLSRPRSRSRLQSRRQSSRKNHVHFRTFRGPPDDDDENPRLPPPRPPIRSASSASVPLRVFDSTGEKLNVRNPVQTVPNVPYTTPDWLQQFYNDLREFVDTEIQPYVNEIKTKTRVGIIDKENLFEDDKYDPHQRCTTQWNNFLHNHKVEITTNRTDLKYQIINNCCIMLNKVFKAYLEMQNRTLQVYRSTTSILYSINFSDNLNSTLDQLQQVLQEWRKEPTPSTIYLSPLPQPKNVINNQVITKNSAIDQLLVVLTALKEAPTFVDLLPRVTLQMIDDRAESLERYFRTFAEKDEANRTKLHNELQQNPFTKKRQSAVDFYYNF